MISRRALIAGAGLAGGAILTHRWWNGAPAIIEADHAAKGADLYERGLIEIEHSGWTKGTAESRHYPELEEDGSADICIVGAGLAGSSLALHLAESGIGVAVLEARQPGWGASGRNAGHVIPVLRSPDPFEQFPDKGERFLEKFAEHRALPFDLQKKFGFDADAVQTGYLNVATSQDAIDDFQASHAWMEDRGILQVKKVAGEELEQQTGSTAWSHALNFIDGGRVNPFLMTNGLVDAAGEMGARIYGGSEALSIETAGARWRIRTRNGSITADKVVFCTNAYPTEIMPAFATAFYPLTAYALTTKRLSDETRRRILPGRQTLAQAPLDLNPMIIDGQGRLVLSSIPAVGRASDAAWHFANQKAWLETVWPEARDIELESYWTGRVALRDEEFPGMFEVQPGLYGLMFFNAWGNLMAPLLGKLLAETLSSGSMSGLPFPIQRPQAVSNIGKQDRIIRHILLPAARQAQRWGLI